MHNIPLAERIRPKNISEFIGQDHIIGKKGILTQIIKNKMIPSIIFWGPTGVGKTTLSQLIAKKLERPFYKLSAINSGVKDIRSIIKKNNNSGFFGANTPILFIDEIHRFSKSQQDSLLGVVEKGEITLIGATTENPSFEIISALLSRTQIYILNKLSKQNLKDILEKAIQEDNILSKMNISLKETDYLINISNGDARKALNILEIIVNSTHKKNIYITNQLVKNKAIYNAIKYDKNGDQHYDIISALIKSIRGNDPNAGIYWLARMIEGGEDAKFIARRLLIFAAEDIGNANPNALVLANNCFQAVNVIGFPEARIILSQTVIYLACSQKSNTSYNAINKAQMEVKKSRNLTIPFHLRNTKNNISEEFDFLKNKAMNHEFLPEEISGMLFYEPANNRKEKNFRENLKKVWKKKYNY